MAFTLAPKLYYSASQLTLCSLLAPLGNKAALPWAARSASRTPAGSLAGIMSSPAASGAAASRAPAVQAANISRLVHRREQVQAYRQWESTLA